jgi:DNA-binding response OmpR family regulator
MPERTGEATSRCEGAGSNAESEVRGATAAILRVLVVDADPALFALLEEWLVAYPCDVVQAGASESPAADRFDLVVVDVPFPRQGNIDVLQRIAGEHPDTPVLMLSASFFSGIESNGDIARALGVAAVLPKPVKRDAFIAAVRRVLARVK